MNRKSNFVSAMVWLLAGLALINVSTRKCFGQTILHDSEQLVVDSDFYRTYDIVLFDTSKLYVVPGGAVCEIHANDFSSVYISGGSVGSLLTQDNSSTYISGGTVGDLIACGSSFTVFYGRDFQLGEGLSLDPNEWPSAPGYFRILGSGTLSGKWLDDTEWTIPIWQDFPTTVILIPEPATLFIFGCGMLILRKRS